MILFRATLKILVFVGILSPLNLYSQSDLTGQWQGMMKQDGSKETSILYLEIIQNGANISGYSKQEFFNTTNYSYYSILGTINQEISQKNSISKQINSKQSNCKYDFFINYDESSGYLTGKYVSSTCRGFQGQVILYRSESKRELAEKKASSQEWFDQFLIDIQKGRKSPQMRNIERKNFKFRPIYFEYDKDEINSKDFEYLREMARIVDGHSDLRIKITGHTDGDGSDQYNDILSKKRAKAIKDFFLKCEIEDFKLVIDYKGKRMPVGDNKTPEGMQDNRRVDFKFI